MCEENKELELEEKWLPINFLFKIDCHIYQKNEETHISGLAGDDATLHKGINIVVMHK